MIEISIADIVWVAICGLIGTVLTAWITTRVAAKKNGADVKMQRIRSLEERLDKVEAHSRYLDDYAMVLRTHISEQKPPPPPPWPVFSPAV